MKLSDFFGLFEDEPTAQGGGFLFHCPAHVDSHPSLIVTPTDNGRLIHYCRAGCSSSDVLNALGLTADDMRNVEIDIDGVQAARSGPPAQASADMIADLRQYINNAAAGYANSDAAAYAFQRFGITEELGQTLRLGYDDGQLPFQWLPNTYRDAPRLVVPFFGIDGVCRGLQSRALTPSAEVRWCGPFNDRNGGHAWSSYGLFTAESDNADLIVTEGPADGLTAVASGVSALFIRGAALSRNNAARNALLVAAADRRVIMAGDADNSGQDFNNTLGALLAEEGVQVHHLPIQRGGDLSEWREEAGDEWRNEFAAAVRNAPRFGDIAPTTNDTTDMDHPYFRYGRTDEGNAQRLAIFNGDNWAYCKAFGWLQYANGAHRPDITDQIERTMSQLCQDMRELGNQLIEEAQVLDDEDLQSEGVQWVRWSYQSENMPRHGNAIKMARTLNVLTADELDKNPDLLVAKNCTIDLRSGEALDHSPTHKLTRGIDVTYDPEAQCPQWLKFLDDITCGRQELADFLQVLIGYGITGHTKEQVLAVFHGTGANGKSVFLNVLRSIFDDVTGVAPFTAFEKKTGNAGTSDIAAIAHARLVFASEGERNAPMAEALIKRLTGSDPVSAAHKYRDHFAFQPQWLLILATNYRPAIASQDHGIWRRMILVPFDAHFDGAARDVFITDKLLTEVEGILAWAVQGAQKWYANGLQLPSIISDAVTDYKETADELAGFVGEIVVRAPKSGDGNDPQLDSSPLASPEIVLQGKDLYDAYLDWTYEENVRPMSRKALFAAVSERFEDCEKFKNNKGVAFKGLVINDGK